MKNIPTFTADQLRQAVREYVARPKHSLYKLAQESGVEWASLKRFVAEDKGLSIENIEKLWPFVFNS